MLCVCTIFVWERAWNSITMSPQKRERAPSERITSERLRFLDARLNSYLQIEFALSFTLYRPKSSIVCARASISQSSWSLFFLVLFLSFIIPLALLPHSPNGISDGGDTVFKDTMGRYAYMPRTEKKFAWWCRQNTTVPIDLSYFLRLKPFVSSTRFSL